MIRASRQDLRAVLMAALLCCFPGCLVVRTSEHIITLQENGSGQGIIHLIDIRSDARSDSLVRLDFDDLMTAYGSAHVDEFEGYGRQITTKRLRVQGDTLMAEVTYTFSSLRGIDGLKATRDNLLLDFSPEREIVRTNGNVVRSVNQGTRISWPRDAKRLVYEVREKQLPPSVSLGTHYQKYVR